jgi:hypothetical protein
MVARALDREHRLDEIRSLLGTLFMVGIARQSARKRRNVMNLVEKSELRLSKSRIN